MLGGPASVKCHSNRSASSGEACRLGSGLVVSSQASLRMRLMVGDLVLKVGRAMTECVGEKGGGKREVKT